MTDIRELLAVAAPEPTRPLDAGALVARARRRPWHRWAAWGAGVIAVLSGAAGAAQLAPASPPSRQVAVRPHPSPSAVAEEPDNVGPAAVDQGANSAAASAKPAGAPAFAQVGVSPSASVVASAAPQPVAARGSGVDEGCTIDSGERCEYDATLPGGYIASGPFDMWITRKGETAYYNGLTEHPADAQCEAVGFVQPGDHVVVSIPATWEQGDSGVRSPFTGRDPGTPPPPPARVSVGPDSHCGGVTTSP